jgi:hypothetical protein
MSLRTVLGFSRELGVDEGTADEAAAKRAALVREKRIEHAREMRAWVEHGETALVRRPPGYFVHADSDEVVTVYRGAIFDPGTAYVAFNETIEMHWYVDGAGEIVFFERTPTPRTWSELVQKRAQREARAAPKPRRA